MGTLEARGLHLNGNIYVIRWLDFKEQSVEVEGGIEMRVDGPGGTTLDIRSSVPMKEFTRIDFTEPSGGTVMVWPGGVK